MDTNQNKEIVRKIYNAFNTGNTSEIDQVVSSDAIDHNPEPGHDGKGTDDLKQYIREYRQAFPDLKLNVNTMVAEGDKVISYLTMTGTHKNEFRGIAPTNKSVKMDGYDYVRISNNKIVERWGVFDMISFFNQLGVIPEPEKLFKGAAKEEKVY